MLNASTEIFRCFDEWGMIQVHERAPYRYLLFGDHGEQSCSCIERPSLLVHQYAQAMMLGGLLGEPPTRAAVLGLGAGTLVNALCQLPTLESVSVVELRSMVADVATQYFAFRPPEKVRLSIDDAWIWLYSAEAECQTLLMVDLYTEKGMQPMQTELRFLQHCWRVLTDGGVLVLNLWDEGRGVSARVRENLQVLFTGGVWCCAVEEGNIVLFAVKGREYALNPRRLVSAARRHERHLGFPLGRYIGALRPL